MPNLSGLYADTPLNSSEISQDVLNIANKSRSNPFSWKGQFSPQLVQVLLERYAISDSVVLDPFLGSGTVFLEAGSAGLAAFGTDINPAAIALSRAYQFINVPIWERRRRMDKLEGRLHVSLSDSRPLFGDPRENPDSDTIKDQLIGLTGDKNDPLQQILIETLIVVLDFYKGGLSTSRVFKAWDKLSTSVMGFPFSENPIKAFHSDARKVALPDSSVDLVVTSPPYINVFNYHQQYRASMEALCWSLLKVAKSEVGSNRKHRSNRFLTVIQYCLDIAQVLKELARVCRADSRIIMVVGRESSVRGTSFNNGEIVAEVAHRALGFDLILRQERVFLNRFGQNIYEDILHFLPSQNTYNMPILERARNVSLEVLEVSYQAASEDVKNDIKSAIKGIEDIDPSPVFEVT